MSSNDHFFVMNTFGLLLALAVLFASVEAANRYGWPDSYERFLERQGVWDFKKHEVKSSYRTRKSYERDLKDLFDDWKKQTRWGQKDYRSNKYQAPKSGFGRYGFPGK
ncbi:Neuropeptide-Like Protein [Caenorhabditis elegans]|uniref:Neuropeptide-Like Protein n=1 Tax=Caenorhabditis elegans TaxID=6239 RepID=Q95YC8_CAEEL|nr:Neuropeptide-Like Protein [Caenorhabditis elegans]CCD63811.1 Neuropeptide-Like Protein [Caenorhabditis elegans]|eukprot:NP_509015.1 Uncharacterized protein CELE_C45B2.3 [Caenorhabditis elegans]